MYPNKRLRRLRYNPIVRDMVRETELSKNDFIYPLFVVPGEKIKKEDARIKLWEFIGKRKTKPYLMSYVNQFDAIYWYQLFEDPKEHPAFWIPLDFASILFACGRDPEDMRKDSFFVLNGDVLTNLNLNAMAKFHRLKRGLGTFLVHKTDHPLDSDLIEYDNNYLIKRFFRPQPGDKFKPISKSGSHIFEPKVLDFIPENTKYSLEKQLIPNLLDQGEKLCAYYSDCYSKDMGTPQRLARVKKDFENGKITF